MPVVIRLIREIVTMTPYFVNANCYQYRLRVVFLQMRVRFLSYQSD